MAQRCERCQYVGVPPRTYHHGALADALVAEATQQVRTAGAERVSLRGVAQAVGVSPSAAYNHFADKDALLAAVTVMGHEELDARLERAAEGVRGTSRAAAVARLRALADAYIGFARSDPNLFRHAFGPHCVDEHGSESRSYALLNGALDDLDARGALRPGARAGLDLALWSLVHGFAELALNGVVPWEASAAALGSFERAAFTEAALRAA